MTFLTGVRLSIENGLELGVFIACLVLFCIGIIVFSVCLMNCLNKPEFVESFDCKFLIGWSFSCHLPVAIAFIAYGVVPCMKSDMVIIIVLFFLLVAGAVLFLRAMQRSPKTMFTIYICIALAVITNLISNVAILMAADISIHFVEYWGQTLLFCLNLIFVPFITQAIIEQSNSKRRKRNNPKEQLQAKLDEIQDILNSMSDDDNS